MRTVKITYQTDLGQGSRMTLETEAVLDSDDEAREAGAVAGRVLEDIRLGMIDESEKDA